MVVEVIVAALRAIVEIIQHDGSTTGAEVRLAVKAELVRLAGSIVGLDAEEQAALDAAVPRR